MGTQNPLPYLPLMVPTYSTEDSSKKWHDSPFSTLMWGTFPMFSSLSQFSPLLDAIGCGAEEKYLKNVFELRMFLNEYNFPMFNPLVRASDLSFSNSFKEGALLEI